MVTSLKSFSKNYNSIIIFLKRIVKAYMIFCRNYKILSIKKHLYIDSAAKA